MVQAYVPAIHGKEKRKAQPGDVYKRQVPVEMNGAIEVGKAVSEDKDNWTPYNTTVFTKDGVVSNIPVSYTHLDVYKRQDGFLKEL